MAHRREKTTLQVVITCEVVFSLVSCEQLWVFSFKLIEEALIAELKL